MVPTLTSLDGVVAVLRGRRDVYVRWSGGPDRDRFDGRSIDDLTGADLPGLSANSLDVAPWWDGSVRLWVARRLHDYSHLAHEKGSRPWLLVGEMLGRGPDNEPLVRCREAVAWVDRAVIRQAGAEIDRQQGRWGPLRRR
ncbi:DUF6098 family protein [Actinocatenispora sera]|uniref:DUF6098 family protein n=1 Tax=Actinocatenispora sera TaxID=390989 RepID=UPI003410C3AB